MTDGKPSAWDNFVREMHRWTESTGHSWVPQSVKVTREDGRSYNLGYRLALWRMAYKRGEITAKQARQVERLHGWDWDGRAHQAAFTWQRDLGKLRDYYAAHRTLEGLEEKEPTVARWLRRVNTHPDQLTDTQRAQLAKIPGATTRRKVGRPGATTAHQLVDATLAWLDEDESRTVDDITKRLVVTHDGAELHLGRIAARRREQYAKGVLDPADIELIETIPGWYWTKPAEPKNPDDGDEHTGAGTDETNAQRPGKD